MSKKLINKNKQYSDLSIAITEFKRGDVVIAEYHGKKRPALVIKESADKHQLIIMPMTSIKSEDSVVVNTRFLLLESYVIKGAMYAQNKKDLKRYLGRCEVPVKTVKTALRDYKEFLGSI